MNVNALINLKNINLMITLKNKSVAFKMTFDARINSIHLDIRSLDVRSFQNNLDEDDA